MFDTTPLTHADTHADVYTHGHTQAPTTPRFNGIRHYPNLIEELEDDHVSLLGTYQEMKRSLEKRNSTKFKTLLANFKSAYTAHLLKEAVRLYIYLRQHLKFDRNSYGLVTAYKNEMDQIGLKIMQFIDDCNDTSDTFIHSEAFNQQFKEIGETLLHRLHREEVELYPLYSSSYT